MYTPTVLSDVNTLSNIHILLPFSTKQKGSPPWLLDYNTVGWLATSLQSLENPPLHFNKEVLASPLDGVSVDDVA